MARRMRRCSEHVFLAGPLACVRTSEVDWKSWCMTVTVMVVEAQRVVPALHPGCTSMYARKKSTELARLRREVA